MTCTKGYQLLEGDLHAFCILDKMVGLHQSMCISKAGHSSFKAEYKDISARNIKIKNLMCQISIQILEYDVIPTSSYQNLKIY